MGLKTKDGIYILPKCCSYPDLDLIGMCEDNYKELDRVYLLNKIIEAVTPSGAPTS